MKLFFLAALASFSFNTYACPNLVGRYKNCFSEIRKMSGEYVVDQHQESDYEVYVIEYNDDETNAQRKDILKTNLEKDIRKETIPKIGVTVKIETRSHCDGNAVVSDADVFFLGAKVGNFVSKIFIEDKLLKSNVDGSYLKKDIHKRIVCELE